MAGVPLFLIIRLSVKHGTFLQGLISFPLLLIYLFVFFFQESDSSGDPDVNATAWCVRGKGQDYRGTMNVTPEGVTCQRWDSQFPHLHFFLPDNFKCK